MTLRKITRSSLQLLVDKDEYPDHIEQIWELGHYLHDLRDAYHRASVTIIKGILSDIGVIETPTCTFPDEDVEESKKKVKELMVRHGDYPEKR